VQTVGFVIPTLNEADRIGQVLASIPRTELEALGYRATAIVVDGVTEGFADNVVYANSDDMKREYQALQFMGRHTSSASAGAGRGGRSANSSWISPATSAS